MSNFEIVRYYFLIFALIIYIINFKEINKEINYRWRKAIKEGRGYYLLKFNKRNNNSYYQSLFKQHYYKNMLYNRKMMKK